MTIAVNMLTYNGASAFIREALGSVYPFIDEIRVYDTGSTDDTLEVVKTLFPKVIISQHDVQHLGKIWTQSPKDRELTRLLNQIKQETQADWILKIDDDEIFPSGLIHEMFAVEHNEKGFIYSVPFIHVGGKNYRVNYIKRFFKNIGNVEWLGDYGLETLAISKSRIRSTKCPAFNNYFYHLGGLRTDKDREHDYSSF